MNFEEFVVEQLRNIPVPPIESKERTVADVFNSLTQEQKDVVYFMIGSAIEETKRGKL